MPDQPSRPEQRQRGFALIIVLWVVTLLALQVSIFNLSVRDAGALAGNELAIARGEALASAGIEMAAARLLEPDDAWRWEADAAVHEVRFGGARLAIAISDEAGRFDINEMAGEALDALLLPVGGSSDALLQWGDRNGPLIDASELPRALGLPARALRPLMPYLTVHGGDGKVNPLVASRQALLLLPGADAAEIDRALQLRRRGGATAADVARELGSVDKWLTERTGPAYRVEVIVRGESVPVIGRAEATILIGKDQAEPFRVLGWHYEPTAPEAREPQERRERDER